MIYRYGAPPTIFALESLLANEEREKFWKAYTANLLWHIERTLAPSFEVKAFTEYVGDTKSDNRSGAEIRDEILRKMGG